MNCIFGQTQLVDEPGEDRTHEFFKFSSVAEK